MEFGQIAAGPFAGMVLADMGADVVKVERPGTGDGLREWPPISRSRDGMPFSENFASLNRNKRSVCADLKDEEHRRRVFGLCVASDVVIENFRPGVMHRIGLAYSDLKACASHLVYCSISGYGQSGPLATKGAFDVTVQAMSGLMSVTGEKARSPAKCGIPVGDFVTGLYAVSAILAALLKTRSSMTGTYIDCSMFGSLLGIAALQTSEYFGTGKVPTRLGSAHPRNAPYQAFYAKDRQFVIAAGTQRLWRAVCDAVAMPELGDDPRFLTQPDRARNQLILADMLQPIFLKRDARDWVRDFDLRGVPSALINDYAEAVSLAQTAHMGLVAPLELPNGRETRTVLFPVSIGSMSRQVRRPPPVLGEHTEEVFSEWIDAGHVAGTRRL